ncbi:MAG: VCBS domain-containing protein [Parvibaculales bacterium]
MWCAVGYGAVAENMAPEVQNTSDVRVAFTEDAGAHAYANIQGISFIAEDPGAESNKYGVEVYFAFGYRITVENNVLRLGLNGGLESTVPNYIRDVFNGDNTSGYDATEVALLNPVGAVLTGLEADRLKSPFAGDLSGGSANAVISGTLDISDAEDDTLTYTVKTQGTYGTLSFTSGSTWQYMLDNDNATIQALNNGQTETDTVTITVNDGFNDKDVDITITINGADEPNNPPEIADSGNTGTITEDADPNTVTGTLTATDADGDGLSWSVKTQGDHGTLTFTSGSTWQYALDNSDTDVNDLNDGESDTDTITVSVTDGTDTVDATITITINGATDAPAGPTLNTVTGTSGADTLEGDAGKINLMSGAGGKDKFTVRLDIAKPAEGADPDDYDVVTDYAATGRGETDRVRFESPSGETYTVNPESTALLDGGGNAIARWVQEDKSALSTAAGSSTNDAAINDTVIYHTNGTADIGDDYVLMVLEDVTALGNPTQFDIV